MAARGARAAAACDAGDWVAPENREELPIKLGLVDGCAYIPTMFSIPTRAQQRGSVDLES
jgi:hypothetical protein